MVIELTKPSASTFDGLYQLIKFYADQRVMLPLSLDEIYHRAQGFRLLVDNDWVIASAHLDIFTPELAEIKSLAVDQQQSRKGYGKIMVEDCEREAKELGIKKVFVLTYQQEFFEKLGYHVVDLNTLPEKVYKECVKCHFYNNCNEIAMVKQL